MYQNPVTPRFYINAIEWANSIGAGTLGKQHLRTLPTSSYDAVTDNEIEDLPPNIFNVGADGGNNMFVALLGHKMKSEGRLFQLFDGGVGGTNGVPFYKHLVNAETSNHGDGYFGTPQNGFSIVQYPNKELTTLEDGTIKIGYNFIQHDTAATSSASLCTLMIGTIFDMPHSPDLSLTMEREYAGIRNIETKGGASLSNSSYIGSPSWGDYAAWNLGHYPITKKISSSGRRIWDLTFSYLDDGDLLGLNNHFGASVWGQFDAVDGGYDGNDINNDGHYNFNILTDYNFYSQVINKTNGGQLPFLFQPDNTDFTNIAICKFQQNSFKFERVALGVYNISLKIREVW